MRLLPLVLTVLVMVHTPAAWAQLTYDVSGSSGSFWIYGPDGNDLIYRMSLTLGISDSLVHTYGNTDVSQGPAPVEDPEFADAAEEWAAFFTDEGGAPIGIEVDHRMYSWTGTNYLMIRYRLRNVSGAPIEPFVSFEIIPTLEGYREYGGETADFLPEHEIGYLHEVGKHLGLKLVNVPFFSYRTPLYADFEAAENQVLFRYAEMSSGANGTFPITDDYGLLVFENAGAHAVAPGDSMDVYVALGYGTDPDAMQAEILTAQGHYDDYFTGVHDAPAPSHAVLGASVPNPCAESVSLSLVLDRAGSVRVEIHDLMGRVVAAPFAGALPQGSHRISWDLRNAYGLRVGNGVYSWLVKMGTHTEARALVVLR